MTQSKKNMSSPDKNQEKRELILRRLKELEIDRFTGQFIVELNMIQGGIASLQLSIRERIK